MEQLQALIGHVERSIAQWQQYVETSGVTHWNPDFEKALKEASDLRQSLHHIEHQLEEAEGRSNAAITITRFK